MMERGCWLFGAFFDPTDFFEQSGLHFRGLAFPSRDATYVGRIDSQLPCDPAVDASIEAQSIQLGIFAIIHVMIRDPLFWSAWARRPIRTGPRNRELHHFGVITPALLSIAPATHAVKE